jgi:tetratricopeptide (TPR) repeat protein
MPQAAVAEKKVFVKEYTYQASEIDSKVSSRTIALEQVKRLLLEELGSYLVAETEARNFQLTKDKITVMTAGIVQTEIIAEKWDGQTYYLKAKIAADSGEVVKLLAAARENNQKNRELEETNRKVDEALKKIKQLQDELASGRRSENSQTEYFKAVDELKWKEWINKGAAFMYSENYQEALNAFSKAAEIDPKNVWAYINRGWAQNGLGDFNQALKELNRAVEIDPLNPWIYANRATSYNSLANYGQALVDADKTRSLDASIAWGYIHRGWAYVGLGNYTQAITELNRAAQLEPANPYIYSTRAWAQNGLNKKRQALEDFDKSLALAPNNSGMHWGLAMYCALTGERDRALSELSKAIRINNGYKQKAKSDKNFQSLWNDDAFRKLVD